jgi:hypothetical protein
MITCRAINAVLKIPGKTVPASGGLQGIGQISQVEVGGVFTAEEIDQIAWPRTAASRRETAPLTPYNWKAAISEAPKPLGDDRQVIHYTLVQIGISR